MLSWSQGSAEGESTGLPAGYNGSYIPSSWKGYILYIVPSCTVLVLSNPQHCGVYEMWSHETHGYNCMGERNLSDFFEIWPFIKFMQFVFMRFCQSSIFNFS